jgi:hypothetical protein
MLYLADTCAPTPAPVAHLVALSIQVNAAACLEQVAPELRIGAAVGPAPADEVRKLIASLLDESAAARGFETSVQAARMGALDMMQSLAHGTNVSPVARFVAGPMVDRESLPMLEHETRVVDAVRHATDWPTTAERLAAIAPLTDGALPTSSLGSGNIVRRLARTHFATLTDRRLAATALAIRLYQLDHGGARPQRLDVLVPAYLPAVPLDAMAAGGQPIRYLPRADHPVLYSVGGNGADDAGDESPMPNEYGDIDEHRRLDRVFYLSGRQRAYIYIARPLPSDGSMLGADAGIADAPPPWERDEAAAAATQPAFTPR